MNTLSIFVLVYGTFAAVWAHIVNGVEPKPRWYTVVILGALWPVSLAVVVVLGLNPRLLEKAKAYVARKKAEEAREAARAQFNKAAVSRGQWSPDGGSTWYDYEDSDDFKKQLREFWKNESSESPSEDRKSV